MRFLLIFILTPILSPAGFIKKEFNKKFGHLKNIHTIKATAEARGKAILRDRNGYWAEAEYIPRNAIDKELNMIGKFKGRVVNERTDIYKDYPSNLVQQIQVPKKGTYNYQMFEQTPIDPWYGTPDMTKTIITDQMRCSSSDRRSYNNCINQKQNMFYVPVMQHSPPRQESREEFLRRMWRTR